MVRQIIQKLKDIFGWHGTSIFVAGMCSARALECFRFNDYRGCIMFVALCLLNGYSGFLVAQEEKISK